METYGNTVLTYKVICISSVTSMDEPSTEEYKTLKGATSQKGWKCTLW